MCFFTWLPSTEKELPSFSNLLQQGFRLYVLSKSRYRPTESHVVTFHNISKYNPSVSTPNITNTSQFSTDVQFLWTRKCVQSPCPKETARYAGRKHVVSDHMTVWMQQSKTRTLHMAVVYITESETYLLLRVSKANLPIFFCELNKTHCDVCTVHLVQTNKSTTYIRTIFYTS